MAELKTKKTEGSVTDFIKTIANEQQRTDATAICKLMEKLSKEKPKMWGSSIIGFGSKKLVYADGRETDWMAVGFSPRKANTVLYLSLGSQVAAPSLLTKLGKHKTGKGCLYINKLADVDLGTLSKLIEKALG